VWVRHLAAGLIVWITPELPVRRGWGPDRPLGLCMQISRFGGSWRRCRGAWLAPGPVLGLAQAGSPAPGRAGCLACVSGCLAGQAGVAGVEAAVAECPAAQAVAGVLGQVGG